MMRIAMQNRWLNGFGIGNSLGEDMEICGLLYVDDTVIFCDASLEQICYTRMILLTFEATYELTCKLEKEQLIPYQ